MKTAIEVKEDKIRYAAITNNKNVDTYRLEVQTHTEIREAINIGIGVAIGFWFITLCPLSLIVWFVLELLG